mmetsp:Transcript_119274/g.338186  ORF Transcript_119274/g.338186 Transcript_119274/m.338186 type:complete len:376 (-) Transcript_119274:50-1177(-)
MSWQDDEYHALAPASGEAGDPQARSGWRKTLLIFGLITVWWVSAICIILEIKRTTAPGSIYPFAFAFTAMNQFATGAMSGVMACALQHHRLPMPSLRWAEAGQLLVIGLMQGVEIGLTNKSLQYLPIATRTMINSTSVFFMMSVAWLWGLERLGFLRVVAALFLFSGGVLQGMDSGGTTEVGHNMGVALQFGSIVASSQRWALFQIVLQHSPCDSALGQMSKLQILSRTMPVTGIVCVVLSLLFELDAFVRERLLNSELWAATLLVGSGLAVMLAAELMLVKLLSAVAFQVLSTIHQIPIIVAGMILDGNRVGNRGACGFVVCMAGALVYAAARHSDPDENGPPACRRNCGADAESPALGCCPAECDVVRPRHRA